jgi:PAS domain S-box-containing protein
MFPIRAILNILGDNRVVMDAYREEFARIKDLLKKNPQGMSVTEIARELDRNKHSMGRYLDILHALGDVEMRAYGMAKVYTLSCRVPLSAFISTIGEAFFVLDDDRRIMQANAIFFDLIGLKKEAVIGRHLSYLEVPAPDMQEMLAVIAAHLGEVDRTFDVVLGDDEGRRDFTVRAIPTLFDGGGGGHAVVVVDVTEKMRAFRAVEVSERKYRELVEHANSIILKMDTEGNIVFFNEFAERFFGYRKEEVLGKNVFGTIVPPTEISGRDLRDLIRKICTGAERYSSNENANITRDGRTVWIRWTNRSIEDRDGNLVGVLSVGNDITDRKEMEQELAAKARDLERRNRELGCLFATSDLIGMDRPLSEVVQGVADLIPGAMRWPDRAAARITLLGEVCSTAGFEGSGGTIVSPIVVGGDQAGSVEGAYFGDVPSGRGPLFDDDEVKLIQTIADRLGWMIGWRDAERALVVERDFASAILDTVGAAVVVLDPEGRILRLNRAGEEISGYLAMQAVGKMFWDLFVLPGEAEQVKEVFSAFVGEGGYTRAGVRSGKSWHAVDGSRRYVDWSHMVLRTADGAVEYVIVTGIDVTREKTAAEDLRRCQALLDRILEVPGKTESER